MLIKVFPIPLKTGQQAAAEAIVEEFAPAGPGRGRGRCHSASTVIRSVPTICCSLSTSLTRMPTTHTPVLRRTRSSSPGASPASSRSSLRSTTNLS